MKKLFRTLVIIFLLYYIFQFAFVYFQGGHDINYSVTDGDNKISIHEIATTGLKKDKDNYLLDITINDKVSFSYTVFEDFGRVASIVDDVKYYEDDKYQCIFVIYDSGKILSDVLCKNDAIMQYYHTIKKPTDNLKKFVSDLKEYGYKANSFKDTATGGDYKEAFVYVDNLRNDHFIGVSYTNGFLRVNQIDKLANVISYKSDSFDSNFKLRGFADGKYATVDYDRLGSSMVVYVHNVSDRYLYQFSANKIISNESYVLGSRNQSIYILDPVNEKEYEIDLSAQNVLEVGNNLTGFLYYEGDEAHRVKLSEFNDSLFSDYSKGDFTDSKYERIDKIGNDYGYYYLYEKVGTGYKAYRSDISNPQNVTYLFTTFNIDKIIYVEDFIYYVSDGQLKYYNDMTGERVVLDRTNYFDNYSPISVYIKK